MHPATTRNEFLRLRVQGLSLARIGRQLGVSKPTLIAWSRQSHPEIAARILQDQQLMDNEIAASAGQELIGLNKKLTFLKQELLSRAFRDIPTAHLETITGELRQRIEQLESLKEQKSQPSITPINESIEPNRTESHSGKNILTPNNRSNQ